MDKLDVVPRSPGPLRLMTHPSAFSRATTSRGVREHAFGSSDILRQDTSIHNMMMVKMGIASEQLIPAACSTTSAGDRNGEPMRAETEKTVAEIEQVLNLLRRHL